MKSRDQHEIKGSTHHFELNQVIKVRLNEATKRLIEEQG